MSLSRCARYLGFAVGPERHVQLWGKALRHYSDSAKRWNALACGLHFSTIAYNTFVVSRFSFLWQLADLPAEAFGEEETALRLLAPGLGRLFLISSGNIENKF